MENTRDSVESAKRAAAEAAAALVEPGMTLGLGTGSTSALFIDALIRRCKEGLSVHCVATSEQSASQARSGGIEVLDFDQVPSVDLTVDGADEVDRSKRLIKGGGGALLREKIVATSSDEMIVIVDQNKVVETLGDFGLPLEVVPFGCSHTIAAIKALGHTPTLRMTADGKPFVTDNGNYTVDLNIQGGIASAEDLHSALLHIPGIVETGLFIGIAGRVIVGKADGSHDLWN